MHEEAGLDLLMEFANINCAYNLMPEDLCTMILLCDALSCAAAPRSTTRCLSLNTIVAVEHGIALLAVMAKNVAQASASIKAAIFKIQVARLLRRFGSNKVVFCHMINSSVV
ncbi:hypothetical protein ACOSP7_009440 [Xanthoceras sorbifolium]